MILQFIRPTIMPEATDELWNKWEQKSAELELPLDYYISEFLESQVFLDTTKTSYWDGFL